MRISPAVVTTIFGMVAPCFLSAQASGPPLDPQPRFAFVKLLRMDEHAPDLRFYVNRSLSGPPVLRVEQHGAFVGDRLVCSWPEGDYDVKNAANMVLGYRGRPELGRETYDGCPTGFPVISTWGDSGHGGAVVYIDVASRKGPIAEVRFQGKPYYFDLNTIPGDPRRPDPALGRRPRGFIGWEWMGILEGR